MKIVLVAFLLLLSVFYTKIHGQRTIPCDTSYPVDFPVELTRTETGFIVPLIQPRSYASDSAKCDVTLVAETTSLIEIHFTFFNESVCNPAKFDYLITGDDCDSLKHCDYLLIHEPYETSRPLKKYDGNHTGDVYTSHSHKVHIRFCFIKPYRDTATRWKLTYRVKERKGVQLFEGSAKSKQGILRTPFFPFGYSTGKDYKWLFVHSEIQGYVFLQFDDMLLAPGHTLEIFDGGGPWANREGRNLTDRRPFFSTGPMVYAALLLSNTSATQVGPGFKLRYDLIQYKRYMSRYKTLTETLANNSAILPGLVPRPYTGFVSLLVDERRSLYYDYLWIIPPLRTPEAVIVRIMNFSFPVGSELKVLLGYNSDANLLYKYVGSSKMDGTVSNGIVSNKGLYLRLTGFFYGTVYLNISYAIFRDLKEDQFNSDKSLGCKFPGDENDSLPAMPGFVCPKSQWCIPDFLKCDGIIHCTNKEDESKQMCGKNDDAPTTTMDPCQQNAFFCVTTPEPCDGIRSSCVTTLTPDKTEGGHYFMTWLFISAPILLVLCISFCMVWVIRKSRNRHRMNNNPPDYQEHISSTISHTVSFTRTLQSSNMLNSHSHSDLLAPSHGDIGPFGIVNPAMQHSESMDSILNMPAPPSYSDVISGNVGPLTRSISQLPPPSYEESENRETTRRQSLPCPPAYAALTRIPKNTQQTGHVGASPDLAGAAGDMEIHTNNATVNSVPPSGGLTGASSTSQLQHDRECEVANAPLTPSAPVISTSDMSFTQTVAPSVSISSGALNDGSSPLVESVRQNGETSEAESVAPVINAYAPPEARPSLVNNRHTAAEAYPCTSRHPVTSVDLTQPSGGVKTKAGGANENNLKSDSMVSSEVTAAPSMTRTKDCTPSVVPVELISNDSVLDSNGEGNLSGTGTVPNASVIKSENSANKDLSYVTSSLDSVLRTNERDTSREVASVSASDAGVAVEPGQQSEIVDAIAIRLTSAVDNVS